MINNFLFGDNYPIYNIEESGVDDVATRKGMKYATAIYDLKEHHLITLLEGRD